MRIAVIGAGTTGTVTGICLAETGHDVKVVEKDRELVEALRQGKLHFFEPGLSDLMKRNIEAGRLKFTGDPRSAITGTQIVFISVGTTQNQDGSSDATNVLEAAHEVSKYMNGPLIVAINSTVPIGTHQRVSEILHNEAKHPVKVVSNPMFFKEGTAVRDFMQPERVVIGTTDEEASEIFEALYSPYVRTGNPIIHMDPVSAEVTKLASNAILASRISFMNNIALLCDEVDADIDQVRMGVGSDTRLGKSYLFAGAGYGGRRFPKDVRDLIKKAKESGVSSEILEATDRINNRQKHVLGELVRKHFGEDLRGKAFAVWGLSYKPGTNDVEDAPSLVVIQDLLDAGASVRVHDPEAMNSAREILGEKVSYFSDGYEACKEADALVLVTEWGQFRKPDFDLVKSYLKSPVVFDGRNIFNAGDLLQRGVQYRGIGKRSMAKKLPG